MKVKLLNDLAKIPTRGSKYAAGYDLYAANADPIVIKPGTCEKIPTGLAMECPWAYFGAVFPRSGIATKQGLRLANSVAVIDEDYRGEWLVPLYNDSQTDQIVNAGDRIAQVVFLPYLPVQFEEVDELSKTERAGAGFGSTGAR